jgi:hypothetical protein
MKQTLLRRGTNTAACMLLLVLLVLSFNCIESPLEPIAPTFDTQLSIPVLDTTQYFNDFAQKDTVFQFNPTDSTYSTTFITEPIPIDTITNQPELSERYVTLEEFAIKGLSKTIKNISAIDGTMNLEFTNRIPIALSFQMSFLKWDSAVAHSDTMVRISSDSLIKAPIVNNSGVAINPKISNISVFLTGAQIDLMPQADSVYIKLLFHLGNELNSVKIKRDDYIRIRSSFTARYTINKPQTENME